MSKTIAYQGVQGAYSEQACKNAYEAYETIACDTFQEAMWMVERGDVDLAMIPLENSTAGRVEEIYRLIPKMSLHVIAEHFEPIVHCLLALPGIKIEELEYVASHPQALAQCHNNILSLGLKAEAKLDTAGAAKELVDLNDPKRAAIASKLAADIYGLEIVKENFEDKHGNTTRFFVLSGENRVPAYEPSKRYITSLVFQVQNIPAALYKVLGGFASNGINLLKIESYMGTQMVPGSQFYIDIDGHIDSDIMRIALREVSFFAEDVRILGVYESHRDYQIEYTI
ncbi:MAG: prephenate dehydratase [Epsilonproteobacteria bacterium]|nr:MAG: prephenate dehydratase [Campylobacterota bacterium]